MKISMSRVFAEINEGMIVLKRTRYDCTKAGRQIGKENQLEIFEINNMVIEIKKKTSINGVAIAGTQSWKELVNWRLIPRESHQRRHKL